MDNYLHFRIKSFILCCVWLLFSFFLVGCQSKSIINIPTENEIMGLEDAVGYNLDNLLDKLNLSEKDLSASGIQNVNGMYDTNRFVHCGDLELRERIQIISDTTGTEYYGFGAYYFYYEVLAPNKDLLNEFPDNAKALYNSLKTIYGAPVGPSAENPGEAVLEEKDWEDFVAGDNPSVSDNWELGNYTDVGFSVTMSEDLLRLELSYTWPELYQTRMVNHGYLAREDAPLYLEGVE